ncbi:hypothetical protein BDV33DRAFT_165712, partial [Aspergillus novoparasiticus]
MSQHFLNPWLAVLYSQYITICIRCARLRHTMHCMRNWADAPTQVLDQSISMPFPWLEL